MNVCIQSLIKGGNQGLQGPRFQGKIVYIGTYGIFDLKYFYILLFLKTKIH